jgi:histidine ammonia-lyase
MIITGKNLTCEKVKKVAREGEKIEIPKEVIERIQKNREIVERKVRNREVMYGVTTGIGELSEVVLTPKQVEEFQRYLIYSHAAGCGNPLPVEEVRAAILSRINILCLGHSGIRPIVVENLKEMLNKGVTPVVYEKGSVGASGDLSPMSQMALVLIGEGEAFYRGKRLPGEKAMKEAGIPIINFEARDGLATINGSNVIAGKGALTVYDATRWIKTSEIALGMTLEVLNANMQAYDERIHKVRGYKGAMESAENVRRIVEGSELLKRKGKRVQDAYSLRGSPQVMGAIRDTLEFAKKMIEIDLNGVGDNPLFFETKDGGISLTCANFQGTPLAFALDFLATAITTGCALSERRVNRLMNPNLSMGLPAFLTRGAGMFSGLMLTQYTAGALVCENRMLAHPASTGSIPAAADQEDFVSMGMNSAIKAKQVLENANTVLAIEFMAGAQAIDILKKKVGKGTEIAYQVIRKYVKKLEEDRPLFEDINRLTEVVKKGEILEEVEKEIGNLK